MKHLVILAMLLPALGLGQLRLSPDSLYLADQNGTPVLLSGDGAWDLITGLTYEQARLYLNDCAEKGINYLQVRLITRSFTTFAPGNAYNVPPFDGPPFTNMNEGYFSHVDSILSLAASKGIYIMLYPAYLGGDVSQGWSDQVAATNEPTMRAYGNYLGSRYSAFPNILWGIGGDVDPTPWQPKLESMVAGIREYDAVHIMSTRDEPGTFATTHWPDRPWITLNGFYPYWSTFNVEYIYQNAKTARSRVPRLPCVLQEAWYENEHGATVTQLRQQAYYTVLGGAIAGAVFGNCPIWHFSQFPSSLCGTGDWVAQLSSPGRTGMKWFGSILRARNWYRLIPDTSHIVTTAGYGIWGGTDYMTTSYASDSTTILAYMPTARRVTIDPKVLRGADIHVWCVNPGNGESFDYGVVSKEAREYQQPGSGDWVLVIDAADMNYSAPGLPVTVNPPAAPTQILPADGTTGVAPNPTLSWNASAGATAYHLQVSAEASFGTTVIDRPNIASTSYALTNLSANTAYYWRVNASNSGGTSEFSPVWGFTTAAPEAPPASPVLTSPENGATGVTINPTLAWNPSPEASSYHLQVSSDALFQTAVVDQANLTSTSYTSGSLLPNTTYYWRVSATGAGGSSPFSEVRAFTTKASTPGPVAAFPFNEGTGNTVADISGHGLSGTIAGATWTTAGKFGGALSFNGNSSYVDLGNPTTLQITGSMTWSAWVKATANPPDDGQIVARSNDATGWQLKTSPDTGPHTFGVAVSGGAGSRAQRYSTTVRSVNTWYYVAGVYNATARTLDIYVNGVLNNGSLTGTIPSSQVIPAVNVNIGRRAPGPYGAFYFNGIIDEVRIYDRALNQAEIQADMNTPLGEVPQPPAAPVLSSPANGATGVGTNTTLTWNASTGATSYRLQVSIDPAFATAVVDQANISGTSFAVTGLATSTLYYWRVSASGAAGASGYSGIWNFTTLIPISPPAVPVLTLPADAATGVATNPVFAWNASPGASRYHLQLSTDSAFASTVLDPDTIAATAYTAIGLETNTRYFWRVLAANEAGSSAYSGRRVFTTVAPPPIPVLVSPANGATGVALSATFSWNVAAGATSYRLQMSIDSTFATTLIDQGGIPSNSFVAGGLAAGMKYFWHVSAANSAGSSAYSVGWRFTTANPTTGLIAAYAFDEGAGTTVADLSGNNLTGTVISGTWTAAGRYGNALVFNGSSSYVNLGNPLQLQITGSMTWSAWVKAFANPADDGQIVAKSNNSTGWQLKSSPDTGPHTFGIAVSGKNGSHTQRYSTTVRALNTWYHVAGVYNATARKLDLYINGLLDNGKLVGTVPSAQAKTTTSVNIGRRSGGFAFNGIIDEVRIYNRALSQSEIQSDMNAPLSNVVAAKQLVGAGAQSEQRIVAETYSLGQNYPNPFNPTTVIRYEIPEGGGGGANDVRLVVYDLLGREVAVLVDEEQAPGIYEVNFDGTSLSSGLYICRITAGEYVESRKMILTK